MDKLVIVGKRPMNLYAASSILPIDRSLNDAPTLGYLPIWSPRRWFRRR